MTLIQIRSSHSETETYRQIKNKKQNSIFYLFFLAGMPDIFQPVEKFSFLFRSLFMKLPPPALFFFFGICHCALFRPDDIWTHGREPRFHGKGQAPRT